MTWFAFWLFLHILAAVIAFGPTFTFPLIGMITQKNPQHLHFSAEIQHAIESRLVTPFAVSMLVSGVGLLFAANIDLLKSPYLIVAIVLYAIAFYIGLFVLAPAVRELVALTATPPPPGAAPGPPPAPIMAAIARARTFGTIDLVLFLAIITLMILGKELGWVRTGPLFG